MARTKIRYSIDQIKEEARQLVWQGRVGCQQRIYTLCEFLPSGEWCSIEEELERNDFLLRDHIIDLIGKEEWSED
jgi:hypothetical protein